MPTPTNPLTTEEYHRAFLAIQPLAAHEHELLRAHYQAPEHTMTATELAMAVGFASCSAVNLHYGKLAGRLCDALGRERPEQNLMFLAEGDDPANHPDGQWRLVLHRPVVDALHGLGWFD